MTSRSKGPRQGFEWLTNRERVPNRNDERGYDERQLFPATDPETGTTEFTVNGYSPYPTVEDGYHATATLEVGLEGGAAVTRLVVEPSSYVMDGAASRDREVHEMRSSPVNSSVMSRVKFTEILTSVFEEEHRYSEALAGLPEKQREIQQRLDRMRRRSPRRDPVIAAQQTEDVLAAMREGRGYQSRLSGEWGIGVDAVKKRVERLRKDGWLRQEYGRPGETLIAWRAALETDDPEPSLNSKED